jgi:hypothetical protein
MTALSTLWVRQIWIFLPLHSQMLSYSYWALRARCSECPISLTHSQSQKSQMGRGWWCQRLICFNGEDGLIVNVAMIGKGVCREGKEGMVWGIGWSNHSNSWRSILFNHILRMYMCFIYVYAHIYVCTHTKVFMYGGYEHIVWACVCV